MENRYLLSNKDLESYNSIKTSIDVILAARLKEFIEVEQNRPSVNHNLFNMYRSGCIDKETFYSNKEGQCIIFDWKYYDGDHSEALLLPIEMFTLDDKHWKVFLFKLQMKIHQEVKSLQKELKRLNEVIESNRLKEIETRELRTLHELQEKYKDVL